MANKAIRYRADCLYVCMWECFQQTVRHFVRFLFAYYFFRTIRIYNANTVLFLCDWEYESVVALCLCGINHWQNMNPVLTPVIENENNL